MKRFFIAAFLWLLAAPAFGQWQVPSSCITVGRGAGVTGFLSGCANTGIIGRLNVQLNSVNGILSIAQLPAAPSYLGIFPFGSVAATSYALAADGTGSDIGLYINRPTGGSIKFKENAGIDQVAILTNGTVQITPVAGLNRAIDNTQNLSGTVAGSFNANSILINSDTAAATGSTAFLNGLTVNHLFGGSTVKGGRNAFFSNLILSSATSASNANRNYAAVVGEATASTADNGTGGTPAGALFASNFVSFLGTGATNWFAVTGGEVDIGIQTGASATIKYGWSVILAGGDAVQGSNYDAAFAVSSFSGATTLGFKNVLLISASNGGFPLGANSCIICTADGSAVTILKGIDLSGVIISGTGNTAFKSPGFAVNGTGAISSGLAGTATGQLSLVGTTSGTAIITAQATAGTPTLTLPNASGTFVVNASSPLARDVNTGNITCATCLTANQTITLSGDVTGSGATAITTTLATTQPGAHTWTAIQTHQIVALGGTAPTAGGDGIILSNTTAAAAGAQQNSPNIHLIGQGWKTNSTAASQTVDWLITNQPVQGAANPSSTLIFSSQINGGGYTTRFNLTTDGFLTLSGPGGGSLAGGGLTWIGQDPGNPDYSGFWMLPNGTAPTNANYVLVACNNTGTNCAGGSDPVLYWNAPVSGGGHQFKVANHAPSITIFDVSTASTSKITGTLTVAGGVGISGATFTDTLNVITMANTATTSAVCYATGTGLLTYDGTLGTCTVSDERKKNMGPRITGALDKLLKINGVYYTWKDQTMGAGRQIGVGAQTVEEVFPELVQTDSNGTKSADYQRLAAPIIEAIRELDAKIKRLERRQKWRAH